MRILRWLFASCGTKFFHSWKTEGDYPDLVSTCQRCGAVSELKLSAHGGVVSDGPCYLWYRKES